MTSDLLYSIYAFFFLPLPCLQALYDDLLTSSPTLLWLLSSPTAVHAARMALALLLMLFYAGIEFNLLPGRSRKFRPDLKCSASEFWMYFGGCAHTMVFLHLAPLIVWEFLRWDHAATRAAWSPVAPSLAYMVAMGLLNMFLFDLCTHFLHLGGHVVADHFKGTRLNQWMIREHALHHSVANRYTYAWTGYVGGTLEGVAGVVFFQAPLRVLALDPVTEIFSILWFMWEAANVHSGFDFAWMTHNWFPIRLFHGSTGHYYHHKVLDVNLSTFLTVLDHVTGTMYHEQDAAEAKRIAWVQSLNTPTGVKLAAAGPVTAAETVDHNTATAADEPTPAAVAPSVNRFAAAAAVVATSVAA